MEYAQVEARKRRGNTEMLNKKLLAVSTAIYLAVAPIAAFAEEVERTSTPIGNAGQTVQTVQVRQGGIIAPSNAMGAMFLCPEQGECQVIFADGSNGSSAIQQILPPVAIVQAARELRPPTYNSQEGDVNVSGVSSASSDQTQVQGQQQGQVATAENGDLTAINTNVTGVDVDANSTSIAGAFAQGGEGGDAFALGLGQGGNATGGNATSGGGNGNCGNGAGGGGNPNGQGNTCD